MGRQETRRKIFKPLRRAGLEVLDDRVSEAALPTFAVNTLISCGVESGRRDAYVGFDEPDFIVRANQAWFALATSSGLFDADRELLLAMPSRWHRVRLLDGWDVMGAACSVQHMGSRAGRPEFAMLSLDGTVAVLGTTWQDGISSLAVPHPADTEPVRRFIEYVASTAEGPRDWRPEAQAWLQLQGR